MAEKRVNAKEIIKNYSKLMQRQYEEKTPFQLFKDEKALFDCVRKGDCDGLVNMLDMMATIPQPPVGTMSLDPLKQAQFTVVSGITLATRYAITGGLPDAEAYRLSDAYLQQLNNSLNEDEAINIFLTALMDFTTRVFERKDKHEYSLHVSKAIKYINSHLHEKISLERISREALVTPQYLSTTFHRETGLTIGQYITREKLKIAAMMLEESDYSIQRIGEMLEFPSQSAFTVKFRKLYKLTPYKYRKSFHSN